MLGLDTSLRLAGYCSATKGPVIINPLQSRNIDAEATAVHEAVHEFLYHNTSLGVLIVLLETFHQKGRLSQEYVTFFREAQAAHELAATYNELCSIEIRSRGKAAECIPSLPTAVDGFPYRELFEVAHDRFPILPSLSASRISAQAACVVTLAAFSMNDDMLLTQFGHPEMVKPDTVAAFLAERSPHARLDTIFSSVPDDVLRSMVNTFEASTDIAGAVEQWRDVLQQLTGVSILEGAALVAETQSTADRWIAYLNSVEGCDFVHATAGMRRPAFAEDPDRLADTWADRIQSEPEGVRTFQPGLRPIEVIAFTNATTEGREALWVSISTNIRLGPFTWLQAAHYPSLDNRNPTSLQQAVDDFNAKNGLELYGFVDNAILEDTLAEGRRPSVLTFVKDSWRRWPNVIRTYERDVLLCSVETELSEDSFRQLLDFVSDGDATPYVFTMRLRGPLCAGILIGTGRPSRYGLMKLPGDLAYQFFCEYAGEAALENDFDPDALCPTDLLFFLGRGNFGFE